MVSGTNGGFPSLSDWLQLAANAGSEQPPSDADIEKRMLSAEDRMNRQRLAHGDYKKYDPLSEGGMVTY